LDQDVPLHGFSTQTHLSIEYGFPGDLQENLARFEALGLGTALTEVDVRMALPEGSEPSEEQLEQQADYYVRTLEACLNVGSCESYTLWGFPDRYSWVPVTFEGEGGATIMWTDYTPKPAYHALRDTLLQAPEGSCPPTSRTRPAEGTPDSRSRPGATVSVYRRSSGRCVVDVLGPVESLLEERTHRIRGPFDVELQLGPLGAREVTQDV